jgi:hypothetical protein
MVNAQWRMAPSFLLMLQTLCVVVHGYIHNMPVAMFRRVHPATTRRIIASQPPSLLSSLLGTQGAMLSPALSPGSTSRCYRYYISSPVETRLSEKLNNNNEEYANTAAADNNDDDEVLVEQVLELIADFRGRPAGVVIEDLNWRVQKLRLEEANTRRFLKAGPRFLPYEECRKWVQAWGNRWQSASEW